MRGHVLSPEGDVTLAEQQQAEFDIFDMIDAKLVKKFGKSPGPRFVQRLYDDLLLHIVSHTIRIGNYRLPYALGSLRLSRLRARSTKREDGTRVTGKPTVRLKWEEGEAIRVALGRQKRPRNRRIPTLVRLVAAHEREQVAALATVTANDMKALLKELNKQ